MTKIDPRFARCDSQGIIFNLKTIYVRTVASGARGLLEEGLESRSGHFRIWKRHVPYATRQRGSKMLGFSTLKSRISTTKYVACVVVGFCSTCTAKDMQIESLLVVLLSKKAPLIIERNTAPGRLNRAIFFLINTFCVLYATHIQSLKRSCPYVTKI